jgi:hypothetical protein
MSPGLAGLELDGLAIPGYPFVQLPGLHQCEAEGDVGVVDDLVALAVIVLVYSGELKLSALLVAAALFGLVFVARALRVNRGPVYFVLGAATWVALLESGIEPVLVGLAIGLLAYAAPPERSALERASEAFREFREQPTPELARSAREQVRRRRRRTSVFNSCGIPCRATSSCLSSRLPTRASLSAEAS